MSENKYQSGKIYKLTFVGGGDGTCYIGSTCTKYLAARLRGHQDKFKLWNAGKYNYVTSFQLLEQGNVEITLLENHPCYSLDELRARERYWIERLQCVNKRIPGRTSAEYHADHREELNAKCRQYHEQNRAEINAQKRKKLECPNCGKEVSRGGLLKHKKRKHSGSSTEPAAVCVEVASSSASTVEAPQI